MYLRGDNGHTIVRVCHTADFVVVHTLQQFYCLLILLLCRQLLLKAWYSLRVKVRLSARAVREFNCGI